MGRLVYDLETRNYRNLPPRKVDIEAAEEIRSLRAREKELERVVYMLANNTETPIVSVEAKREAWAILKG